MQPVGFRVGALLVLIVSPTAWSVGPASLPTDMGHASPAAASLVPPAACTRGGPGRLAVSKATIVLGRSAAPTARYAAQCLQAEFSRLFNMDVAVSHPGDALHSDSVLIFVNDAGEEPLPECFAMLRELPIPGEDGFRLGVFPQEKAAVVLGYGGNGVVRGVFALARLAGSDGRGCFLPEVLISDTPDMRMRFTRGIFSDSQTLPGITAPMVC